MRRLDDSTSGSTFLGAYAIFFPMHYLGLLGMPRRYHDIGETAFIPASAHDLNAFMSVAALIVGFAQLVFLFNLIWSLFKGKEAGGNPWGATSLEWQTPQTPPGHGNWGKELPIVYRWAYDYSVPGAARDFMPQNEPPAGLVGAGGAPMSAIILFMAAIAAIAGWWLSQQRLAAKPWLEEGLIGDFRERGRSVLAAGENRIGRVSRGRRLVVRTLHQRLLDAHEHGGLAGAAGAPAAVVQHRRPGLEQCARCNGRTWPRAGTTSTASSSACAQGGASAVTFLIGQLLAWQQLSAAGYFLASNPANSFFYLITAVHGLHLMGGLVALGRTTAKVWRGVEMAQVRLSVELCAIYWHFLLLVWLVLLGLLTGWTDDFVDICRQLLTLGRARTRWQRLR